MPEAKYQCPRCGYTVTVRVKASEVYHGCQKQSGLGNSKMKEKKDEA